MPRKPSLREIVSAIYLDEGFYEVHSTENSVSVDKQIILSDGRRELILNILSEDSCTSKARIQDALIELMKLVEKFDGVVLAVPRKFVRMIDENVLAKHGIGLVIYDTMGAEEIVPPRFNEKKIKNNNTEEIKVLNPMQINELIYLRSEISKVMKILEEFEARLDRIEQEHRSLITRISKLEEVLEYVKRENVEIAREQYVKPSTSTNAPQKLPSFLLDNPWVEILSKRE
ncbi:MAG: hypothetical protein L4877_03785 [Aigarchaeota archaeon]|nr:hypothetical protein [Candidatus Geocrenenecus dongiae]